MFRPSQVDDAINVDEIGIRTGWYGDFHLKTAYQPVFRHRFGMLHPIGVEGLIRPFRRGLPVAPLDMFNAVPEDDRFFVESLCRTLHLKNHVNIDVPGLEIFFNYDPFVNRDLDQAVAQLEFMAERLTATDLDIRLLVCEITETDAIDRDVFVRLAAEIRRLGMRLAIDDFGAGHSTLERVRLIEPDIIKIDGPFFRRVVAAPKALHLLMALVEGFHRDGTTVVFEGIETPDELLAAIDCGADCVQGHLLGSPELAGSYVDLSPKPLQHYAGTRDSGIWRRSLG